MSNETVPLSLFQTGRGLCPDCGAPLSLPGDSPVTRCTYCGGTAAVARRLRTLEPVLDAKFITADAPPDTARLQRPSHLVPGVSQDESHCPGCGCELLVGTPQAIFKCPQCGTVCKIERRLLRSPVADADLIELEENAGPTDQKQFDATEAAVLRTESSIDLSDRVRAAQELGEFWAHANARAARLLPRVFAVLNSSEPAVELPLAEMVGKLLCSHDPVLSNAVLRAAEKVVFDPAGSRALLFQLGLGSGVGLKLLLDVADHAGQRGSTEYACAALWAVNCMFERNYADRMRLAEVVLYRLLYLRGPVQAWALQLVQGQLGLGCRFPTTTLLHFIDDCAVERPELVPHLEKCFYDRPAEDSAEWVERFDRIDTLYSDAAQSAAIQHLYAPPGDVSEKTFSSALDRLLTLAERPGLFEAVETAVAAMIDDNACQHESVHAMIRRHGDRLARGIRAAYLRQFPKSPELSPVPDDYGRRASPPPTPFDLQLAQWSRAWDGGIRHAVADLQNRRAIERKSAEISGRFLRPARNHVG